MASGNVDKAKGRLKDAAGELVEVNFADQGLQLARTTHALKLWLSLQHLGLTGCATLVDASVARGHGVLRDALLLREEGGEASAAECGELYDERGFGDDGHLARA